ncbi:MAG: hypothetical protein HYV26_17285, partial [Candidatus Hydrogenedentes bacterium]|nr:hypothetical protein [Candidatus Hydrogenedentota bacterium]
MSIESFAQSEQVHLGRRLAGLYTRTMIWYLGGVLLLWLLGLEGIYGHPTPFYAAYAPAFQ